MIFYGVLGVILQLPLSIILNGNYINRDCAVDGEPELIDHWPYCDQDLFMIGQYSH